MQSVKLTAMSRFGSVQSAPVSFMDELGMRFLNRLEQYDAADI